MGTRIQSKLKTPNHPAQPPPPRSAADRFRWPFKMNSLPDTIAKLQAVITDPNFGSMNQSTVKGFLGEVLVRKKLISEGANVTHMGNQKGYDLLVTSLAPEMRIDVKTSAAHPIGNTSHDTWGWALHSTSKKRAISCTHFVCIALDRKFFPFAYYVISSSLVAQFPAAAGQFRSVTNTFAAHHPTNPFTSGGWHAVHQKCEELLNLGVARRIGATESLLEALRMTSHAVQPTP